jgi:small-conductance mechanosensitive channel
VKELNTLLENPLVKNAIILVVLFVIIFLTVKIIKRMTMGLFKENNSRYHFKKLINFLGYVLFIIGLLIIFNDRLSGLGTALGVAGAGIAFALQEVIVSIAGYIAIFTSNFYRLGDRVQLGGIKGDVVDIGLLRTTLMEVGDWVDGDLYNGKMVRVANSFVFKEPVYNYSGDFPFLWDEIKIPIKTTSDYEYAKKRFYDILKEQVGAFAHSSQEAWNKMIGIYKIENARVQPMVSMKFNESWITFTLRYVVDFKLRRATKSVLYDKILLAIRASEGKIQVASASMEITAFPVHS